MPAARINMRKIKDVLCLKLHAGLSHERVAASLNISKGVVAKPMGTAHPLIAPYQTFACADGAIAIGGGNQANWLRIADTLGHPEWAAGGGRGWRSGLPVAGAQQVFKPSHGYVP